MDKITIEVTDLSKVSDGYHTIEELYDHRCLLFINLCLALMQAFAPSYCGYIKEHYKGWFLLGLVFGGRQISYHIPNKFLPLVEGSAIPEDTGGWIFDGHTSKDVLERLQIFAGGKTKAA